MKHALLFLILISSFRIEFANSQTWTSVGSGMNNDIYCMQTDTANNLLYAGGYFTTAGSATVSCIAAWNGVTWNTLGTGISGTNGHVRAMTIYNGELYAGGHFALAGGMTIFNLAKWNGTTWSVVGGGVDSSAYIECFAEYNGELYVGGYLFTTAGTSPVNSIAKWNGTTWSSVGSGVSSGVQALSVYNGKLYAAGEMTQAGGINVNNIAKWDGASWSDVNGGLTSKVFSLCNYNNELYAGGNFFMAGTTPALNIAKWNGITWDSVATGIDWMVDALTVFDGSLYAGGLFWNAGRVPVNNIARWNGINWSSVGIGIPDLSLNTTPIVRAIEEYNSCLYAGGIFNIAIGSPSNYIAKWDCNPLGTEDILEMSELKVFPNPCYYITTVSTNIEMKEATLFLYNSLGNIIQQYDNISGKHYQLNLNNFNSGVYFIKIFQENETYKLAKISIANVE